MKPTLMCITLLAALSFVADVRGGDYGYGISHGLPYYGFGFSGSLYGLGYVPVPPYYALHPPVYYSYPIPHPYGASPYARRPMRDLPRYEPGRVCRNPFVTLPLIEEEIKTETEPTATANVIRNPYYSDTELAGHAWNERRN